MLYLKYTYSPRRLKPTEIKPRAGGRGGEEAAKASGRQEGYKSQFAV